MTHTIGDDPITLFGEMEIDPTLSLEEMYKKAFHIAESCGYATYKFSSSIIKILDTTAEPPRYFDLEYAVPAVSLSHTQRLVKITEWRQVELWVMP